MSFTDDATVQIFHCLQPDKAGGDTLLVDGFKVAEELEKRDASAFHTLCTTPITFQHTSEGVRACAP